MQDTDWRPSACPKCGKFREAGPTPTCENVLCVRYKYHTDPSPDQPAPTPQREVTSFKDLRGGVHPSLKVAVESDVCDLLGFTREVARNVIGSGVRYKLIALLQELD